MVDEPCRVGLHSGNDLESISINPVERGDIAFLERNIQDESEAKFSSLNETQRKQTGLWKF